MRAKKIFIEPKKCILCGIILSIYSEGNVCDCCKDDIRDYVHCAGEYAEDKDNG